MRGGGGTEIGGGDAKTEKGVCSRILAVPGDLPAGTRAFPNDSGGRTDQRDSGNFESQPQLSPMTLLKVDGGVGCESRRIKSSAG